MNRRTMSDDPTSDGNVEHNGEAVTDSDTPLTYSDLPDVTYSELSDDVIHDDFDRSE